MPRDTALMVAEKRFIGQCFRCRIRRWAHRVAALAAGDLMGISRNLVKWG